MCGIFGYVGSQKAQPILINGLRQLEYRGYDSAGLATIGGKGIKIEKEVGRVIVLANKLKGKALADTTGISHTRWATHGKPTTQNAHPHIDGAEKVAVVHNGVIENYTSLKQRLNDQGVFVRGETDTAVAVEYIGQALSGLDAQADDRAIARRLRVALDKFTGSFALAILVNGLPGIMIGARRGSPLVLGIGQGENFIASDAASILPHTRSVIYLNDGDIVIARQERFTIHSASGSIVTPSVQTIRAKVNSASAGFYKHFMLKEINEQPEIVRATLDERIDHENATSNFKELQLSSKAMGDIDRIVFTACGTSWHAALLAEYLIETMARIPVEVEYASELRYRHAPVDSKTLLFCISQSGETADTLAAMREYQRRGLITLAIVNTEGSSLDREADGRIYLNAGPEIGVASTKSFTAQVIVLTLLALGLGRQRGLAFQDGLKIISSLEQLPDLMNQALGSEENIKQVAHDFGEAKNMLFMGRGYNFPIALEGALKIKEVSYVHAEGYPAAEMKHGPIALVDEDTPSVIINPKHVLYDKVISNLEEIKARGGPVIAIASEGDTEIASKTDHIIYVPACDGFAQPILMNLPLQLLAYHSALLRGCDVDKPRNLAKSVTVE